MLSSNGKELYCAASSCQKTRQVVFIWHPNICFSYFLVSFIAFEVGKVMTINADFWGLKACHSMHVFSASKMIMADQKDQILVYFKESTFWFWAN